MEELDRWIGDKLKRWTSGLAGAPRGRKLLEIRRDILEDVRDRIEPKGQGRYVFPFNDISIVVGAVGEAERDLYQAALADDDAIAGDIRGLLTEAGCAVPPNFHVEVEVALDEALASAPRPFRVDYHKRKTSSPPRGAAARPGATLTVARGAADAAEFVIASDRVNIGRMKEVVGEKDGLRRRNDVAFDDAETTVSREHAYIRFDAATGAFRLCDYQSARGSTVFRGGRRIEVPRASPRGVQLQSGDEIHLGDARIRFEIDPPPQAES